MSGPIGGPQLSSSVTGTTQSLLDMMMPSLSGAVEPHTQWFQKHGGDRSKVPMSLGHPSTIHDSLDTPAPPTSTLSQVPSLQSSACMIRCCARWRHVAARHVCDRELKVRELKTHSAVNCKTVCCAPFQGANGHVQGRSLGSQPAPTASAWSGQSLVLMPNGTPSQLHGGLPAGDGVQKWAMPAPGFNLFGAHPPPPPVGAFTGRDIPMPGEVRSPSSPCDSLVMGHGVFAWC